MKTRLEIEIRMSEIRAELNATEEPDNADQLRTEYRALETDYRGVLEAEQEAEQRQRATRDGNPDVADDGEGTEYRELVNRVELRTYLHAAAVGRTINDGAEQELGKELNLDGGSAGVLLPWEVLDPGTEDRQETEDRAVTSAPTAVGVNQQGIIGRVFARTGTAHLGVRFPSVPVGTPLYTYISGGNAPGFVAESAAADETAGAFTAKSFKPVRLTASYRMTIEDLAVLRGMEASLRADLRGALAEVLDKQVIGLGDGNVRGILAAADNGGLADVTAATSVVTVALMETGLLGPLDGKHATTEGEIRYLMGADTFVKLYGLTESGTRPFDKFKGRVQVSAHVPAADATSKASETIAVTQRGPVMVAPVWQGVEIIRDPYTAAAKGEVVLTAAMLANFGIVRKDGATRISFKLTA